MTWIRTVSLADADEKLRQAIEGEKLLYPKEYADPVHPDPSGASSIVGSHTLIPDALYHAFATFGALRSSRSVKPARSIRTTERIGGGSWTRARCPGVR